MEMDLIKNAVRAAVEQKRELISGIVMSLYDFAETALLEQRSATLLADLLEEEGFTVQRAIAGMDTAFIASHGSGGPVIAILAEMDALPEIGHGCGHNIIAAAAVGAALSLCQTLPLESARIVVLGTPAEETGIGKIKLIEAGFFEGIDFAMMIHPSSKRQVVKMFLGLAKVRFTFFGRAAHAAAYPEEGINALDAVIQIFNSVNALRQHLREDVRVHGIITNGGKVPNMVPAEASCYYYIRGDDVAEVTRVVEKVISCARGAAIATGCRVEVEKVGQIVAPMKINRSFSDLYSQQLVFLGLEESAAPVRRNRGSSDVGNVSQVVPTIHPHVPIGEGIQIHTKDFAEATISERGKAAAVEGSIALALTATELVFDAGVRERIRAEFRSLT